MSERNENELDYLDKIIRWAGWTDNLALQDTNETDNLTTQNNANKTNIANTQDSTHKTHATQNDPSKKAVPKDKKALENATELYLKEHNRSTLPDELGQLKRLEKLTAVGFADLKKSLFELTNLKVLDFSGENRNFGGVGEGIAKLQRLEELNLSQKDLSIFPKVISKLTNLKVLKLSGCKLGFLPNQLEALQSLEELDLSHNSSVKKSSFEAFFDDMFNKEMGIKPEEPIKEWGLKNLRVLGELVGLKRLNLSCCGLMLTGEEFVELKKL